MPDTEILELVRNRTHATGVPLAILEALDAPIKRRTVYDYRVHLGPDITELAIEKPFEVKAQAEEFADLVEECGWRTHIEREELERCTG